MFTPRVVTPVLAIVMVIGFAGLAFSTTVEERSIRDLAVESPTIVHGTVVATSSRWTDDRSLIVTDIRVRVNTVIKGNPPTEVLITQPGGTVGKLRVDVSGASAYRRGQEAVLFLRPAESGQTIVTGLFQGRFDVSRDAGDRKVVRGVSAEDLQSLGTAAAAAPRGAPMAAPSGASVTLDQFLGGIRGLVDDIQLEGGK